MAVPLATRLRSRFEAPLAYQRAAAVAVRFLFACGGRPVSPFAWGAAVVFMEAGARGLSEADRSTIPRVRRRHLERGRA